MRYELQLTIDAPRDRVVPLFLDPDALGQWQPDLVRFEPIEGAAPRTVGAKSRQVHRMGAREVEMIETITVHDPPDRFAATYEAKGVWTLVSNRLTESPDGKTHWILTSECRFSSPVLKLMAWIAPGLMRRQTENQMRRFRTFAEASVARGSE